MTHKNYAFIKNNNVVNVVVFDDPTEELLQIFKDEFELDLIIEATPKTCINGTFDGDNFWAIQPFPSWIKDENTIEWKAPIVKPNDNFDYQWNEQELKWVKIDLPLID